jgi:hypothetical protein
VAGEWAEQRAADRLYRWPWSTIFSVLWPDRNT